jgi:hypothetical protein
MSGPSARRPPWHALLAPVPADAAPVREPIGPPEMVRSPEGAAIAGWQNLSLELSAGPAGARHLLLVLDATGRAIAASDHVLYRWADPADPAGPWRMRQESIGGRIETDGGFQGTHWITTGPEPVDDQAPHWESTPRAPTDAETAALLGLVSDLLASPWK